MSRRAQVVAVLGFAAPLAQGAAAQEKGLTLSFSGQVNPAMIQADQDTQGAGFLADNDGAGSRLEMRAERAAAGLTFGGEVVVSLEANTTDAIDFPGTRDAPGGQDAFGEFRQAHGFLDSDSFGYVSIGHGDTAAEDTATADVTGTDFAGAGADVDAVVGGLQFLGGGGETLDRVDAFFDAQDGSRSLRLFYRTPRYRGFAVMASLAKDALSLETEGGTGRGVEPAVGLTYSDTLDGSEVKAEASWRRDRTEQGDRDVLVASASIHAASGVSAMLAGSLGTSRGAAGSKDATMVFAKLGYRRDVFGIGETRFSFDAYHGRNGQDFAAPGGALPRATGYGVFAVQEIARWQTELYAGARLYALDAVFAGGREVEVDDLTALIAGARVSF